MMSLTHELHERILALTSVHTLVCTLMLPVPEKHTTRQLGTVQKGEANESRERYDRQGPVDAGVGSADISTLSKEPNSMLSKGHPYTRSEPTPHPQGASL